MGRIRNVESCGKTSRNGEYRIMTTFKEDEYLLKLIKEIIEIQDKLEPDNDSKIRLVLSVDERIKLEKQSEELGVKLITKKIELDRIRIRETPHYKAIIDFFRQKGITYGPIKEEDFDKFWEDNSSEILEFHEETEVLDRGAFLRNYFTLIPPYVKVGTNIPEEIQNIYHESRWCFVYKQYSAVIALSRAVIETVLKNKYHLEGKLNDIIEEAENRKLISPGTAWNAHRVRTIANDTLHKAKPTTEDQAKDAINYTLRFLEEIFFERQL